MREYMHMDLIRLNCLLRPSSITFSSCWFTIPLDWCRNAIKDLSVGLSLESSNIECLYLRASCHHAIGEYREAVLGILFLCSPV